MEIKRFTFSPFQENTYLVWDKETRETAIIDPSCLSETEERELEDFISGEQLNVKYLFNTHGHLDHIFGNDFITKSYSPIHIGPEKDLPLFDRGVEQAKGFGITMKQPSRPTTYFSEDETVLLGNAEINFLFTPGHTPGEFSICFPESKICFTGDVLFKDSIGRTDLWGGDYDILMRSIKEKLLVLSGDTKIYPGHGDSSTIEFEIKNNQFLNHLPLSH